MVSFPAAFQVSSLLGRKAVMAPVTEKDLSSAENLLQKGEDAEGMRDQRLRRHVPILFHVGFFCFYTLVFLMTSHRVSKLESEKMSSSSVFSPAQGAVSYEAHTIDVPLGSQSPFVGYPRPELDDAWHSVLKHMNIRVDEETLYKMNRTSIPLRDGGGGYLAALDVHHELHCLNTLRKQIYREVYPDPHSKKAQLEHADHCIDILRQVLMCHGDISLQFYDWIDDYRWPWPNFKVQHECKNWEAIDGWAAEHFVPTLKGPVLVHPTLGESYRGDEVV